MIKVEEYNGNLVKTYSDAGMKIERDGVRYDEAIDPVDSGRTYTETDELTAKAAEEAVEVTMEDLENALKEAGIYD